MHLPTWNFDRNVYFKRTFQTSNNLKYHNLFEPNRKGIFQIDRGRRLLQTTIAKPWRWAMLFHQVRPPYRSLGANPKNMNFQISILPFITKRWTNVLIILRKGDPTTILVAKYISSITSPIFNQLSKYFTRPENCLGKVQKMHLKTR